MITPLTTALAEAGRLLDDNKTRGTPSGPRLVRALEALVSAVAEERVVLARLSAAATEVNTRYIGGSPMRGPRFTAAIDQLAATNLYALRSLRAVPHQEPTS